ncbi:MAG: hypothetical protein ACOYOK_02670 [Pseudobdellovibrionaceae bacterium]
MKRFYRIQSKKWSRAKASVLTAKGFTLIETLLAAIILSGGLALLSHSWNATEVRNRKTQLTTVMASLLQRKMQEVEMEYKDKPLESIPEEQEDDFGSEYPKYSWKMVSKEFAMPDLSSSLISRAGGADQMMITVIQQMSEHLSKSIKEVKVTVIYKGGKKPFSYSVTTYFIDYDRPLPLGGGGGGAPASGDSKGGGG